MLAIIGGTGFGKISFFAAAQKKLYQTPYGEVNLWIKQCDKRNLVFLPRHGDEFKTPPHLINYRANIAALAAAGVSEVLALCSVGSMDQNLPPGSLLLLEQFLDHTWGREQTFCQKNMLGHVDMTEPYCCRLSQQVEKAAAQSGIVLKTGGNYYCTQGPRFESPLEISAAAKLGCNVVGMTSVPEVSLAREAGLCYASIAIVANYAAGLAAQVDGAEITARTKQTADQIASIIQNLAAMPAAPRDCACREAGFYR